MPRAHPLLAIATLACSARVVTLPPIDAAPDAPIDAAVDAAPDAPPPDRPPPTPDTPTRDGPVDEPLRCGPGEWCWQHPRPQGNPLHAVFTVSADEAWAVGASASIVRYQRGAWTAWRAPVDVDFEHVWGRGADDVWAWGSREVGRARRYGVAHWDGARWSTPDLGPLPVVVAVSGGGDAVWVVTASEDLRRFELLRWNGNVLVQGPPLPTDARVTSLCVRSSREAWIASGDSRHEVPAALLRWDGSAWREVLRATGRERFTSPVACPADDTALAVYHEPGAGTESLVSVRGATVERVVLPLPRGGAPRLLQTPHGEAYFFDGERAMRWTAARWEPAFVFSTMQNTFSTRFDLTPDRRAGWLVERDATPRRWVSPTWAARDEAAEASLVGFVGADGAEVTDVLGGGHLARRSGDAWAITPYARISPPGVSTTYATWSAGNGDVWAVGVAGSVGRWSFPARTFSLAELPPLGPRAHLRAVDGSDPDTVWAVGDQGTVLRREGARWSPAPPLPREVDGLRLTDLTLSDVSVRSARDVLVLGDDPAGGRFVTVLFAWDGVAWRHELITGSTFDLLERTRDGAVYLASDDELLVRVAREGWRRVPLPEGRVRDLRARPSGGVDVLAVANRDALVYELAAGATELLPRGPRIPTAAVTTLHHGPRGELWVAGGDGAILRYEPPR